MVNCICVIEYFPNLGNFSDKATPNQRLLHAVLKKTGSKPAYACGLAHSILTVHAVIPRLQSTLAVNMWSIL